LADEHSLIQTVSKAKKAEGLLKDELLTEAFAGLETAYIEAWRKTTIEDVQGREKLFLAINVIAKVRDHLTSIVNGGKVAASELQELQRVAERKKRFGIA
jgi:hypothetical protein